MKLHKVVPAAVALLCMLPLAAQETSGEATVNQSENNPPAEGGEFDFASAFASSQPASPEKKGVAVGGELATEFAQSTHNGELKRAFVKADLDLGYTEESTEVKAVVRAERDSLRGATILFKDHNAYEASRKAAGGYDASAINDNALTNDRLLLKNSDNSRVYLREGYVSHDFNVGAGVLRSINLKAGSIIYTWGNADETKPVDIINHQDLSYSFIKPLQERKYGELSLNPTFFFTDTIFLEGVAAPWFEPSETASTGFYDYQLGKLSGKVVAPVLPDAKAANFTWAARLGATLFDVDMHLNYFHGPDKTPTLSPVTGGVDLSTGTPVFSGIYYLPEYKNIQMVGFDFQRTLFAGISARGECAWFTDGKYFMIDSKLPVYMSGAKLTDEQLAALAAQLAAAGQTLSVPSVAAPVERDVVQYCAGFDDTDIFGVSDLYGNFQIYQQFIMGDTDGLSSDAVTTYLTAKIEYSMMRQKLKLAGKGLFDAGNLSGGINTECSYALSTSCSAAAGTWQFFGKKENRFGQYKDDGFVYTNASVRY